MQNPRWTPVIVCALALVCACHRHAPEADVQPDEASQADHAPAESTQAEPGEAALEQLCAHGYEVLIVPSGAASPGVRDDFMRSCLANAEAKREALGEPAWTERSRCILAGQTPADLARCDGREPPPEREPPDETDGRRIAAACDHVFDLIEKEIGAGLYVGDELEKARKQCIEEFENTRASDPAESDRVLGCILAANDIESLAGCE